MAVLQHQRIDKILTTEGSRMTCFVYFVDKRCRYIMSRSSRGKVRNEIDGAIEDLVKD